MRGSRIALGLALFVSVVALTGCGLSKTVDPVAGAATKTENGGAKVSLTASLKTPSGESYSLSASGVVSKGAGDVTVQLPDSGGQAELRYLDENGDRVLYVNSAQLSQSIPGGKPWVRLDLQQLGEKLGVDLNQLGANASAGQSPGDILDLLRSVGAVQTVGNETVDGASTTHYRATIELDQVAKNLGGPLGQVAYDELTKSGAPTSVPVDVWVGDDGLVHRASIDETVPVQSGGTATFQVQLDVSDYGAAADVEAPPSDQVLDVTGLLAQLHP
jgi:hypothetical protein